MRKLRPRPLRVVSEYETLLGMELDQLAGAPDGGWAMTRVGGYLPPHRMAELLEGRVAGQPRPDWADGSDGAYRGQIHLVRVLDAWLAPRHGALIDHQGRVFQRTVGEMLSWNPDLAALPFVEARGETRYLAPPARLPRLKSATVFMATGGTFNYGHCLLDCLPSLLAVEEAGLTEAFPPVAPPMTRWNRDLLGLAFPGLKVRTLRSQLVRVDETVYSTSLDHFLHRPNKILLDLRDRILANAPPASPARRVYISRRSYSMRVMVNETELEAALAARGFEIIRAERLSVAEQIACMRGADVVVGATGAGLANALMAPGGAKIFEILPEGFTAPWLRNMIHLAGNEWHGFFCPAPVDHGEVPWRYRIRRGFRWGYRLPLDAFLSFLDASL